MGPTQAQACTVPTLGLPGGRQRRRTRPAARTKAPPVPNRPPRGALTLTFLQAWNQLVNDVLHGPVMTAKGQDGEVSQGARGPPTRPLGKGARSNAARSVCSSCSRRCRPQRRVARALCLLVSQAWRAWRTAGAARRVAAPPGPSPTQALLAARAAHPMYCSGWLWWMTIRHVGQVLFSSRYLTRQLRQTVGRGTPSAGAGPGQGPRRSGPGPMGATVSRMLSASHLGWELGSRRRRRRSC